MATDLESLVLSISADTTALKRALDRMEKDAKGAAQGVERSFSNIDPMGRAAANFNKSSKAIAADALNIRFQLGDIATQIGSGTSALQAFAQQAGQLGSAIESGGLAAVGVALKGMLNPLYLIPTAISLAIPAIQYFFKESKDGGQSAAKALETQRDLIRQVANEWGNALPELQRYNTELEKQEQLAKRQEAIQAAINKQYEGAKEGIAKLAPTLEDVEHAMGRMLQNQEEIAELRTSFDALQEAIKNGTASSKELAPVLKLLNEYSAAHNNILAPLIAELSKYSGALDSAATSAGKLRDQQAKLGEQFGPFLLQVKEFNTLPPLSGADILRDVGRDFQETATKVHASTMQFIKDRESFTDVAKKDVNHFRVGWYSDTLTDEYGRITEVTEGMTTTVEAANRDLVRRISEAQAEIAQVIGAQKWLSLSEDQQTALTSIVYNYGELPKRIVEAIRNGDQGSVAQAIAGLGTDNKGVNMKRRQMEAELYGGQSYTAKAAKETIPYIDEEGRAMDKAAVSAAHLLQAQRELTPEQKRLADSANAVAQQYAQIAQTAIGGFVNDLRNGVEAGEAFRNMLNRVIDGIINMAIEAMFAKNALGGIFGGFLGGGGGVTASAATMHTGGKVGGASRSMRSGVNPAIFAGAPRFHNGLLPGEFPAILQKGEIVLPKNMAKAAAAGGDNSRVDIGNIEINVPGGVAANSDQGKALGVQIDKAVQAIIVRERRPGGLLRT